MPTYLKRQLAYCSSMALFTVAVVWATAYVYESVSGAYSVAAAFTGLLLGTPALALLVLGLRCDWESEQC